MDGFAAYPGAASVAPLLEQASIDTGIPASVLFGLVAQESGFDPRAYRAEPAISDASYGLMQILGRTAAAVGYTGPSSGLFDPLINVTLGMRYLRGLVDAKGGDLEAAVSAYNNGGGNRAKDTTTVCDERNADRTCRRTHVAQPGQFFNQPYVDAVFRKAAMFGWGHEESPAPIARGDGAGAGWLSPAMLGLYALGAWLLAS